jgi:hypothetical protein
LNFYWEIRATNDYIRQLGELSIETQASIGQRWIEVATSENPLSIGKTVSCPQGRPFVLVIFPGLAYEFVYKLDEKNKIILLINCERLTFLDHGQID